MHNCIYNECIYISYETQDFLSPEEFHKLLSASQKERDRTMLLLLGGVGLRVREAASLKIEDLDMPAGYLYVRAEVGKGKKSRTCVLSGTEKMRMDKATFSRLLDTLVEHIECRPFHQDKRQLVLILKIS